MSQALVFFGLVGPAFLFGFWLGGLHQRKKRAMPQRNLIDYLFSWFALGNRLVGLVVVTMVLAVGAGLYTFQANQSGESRDQRNLDCLTDYVAKLGAQSAPRTQAAKAASDARRDWDRGHSTKYPELTREELKTRYLALYEIYDEVSKNNPPPKPISQYCKDFS